MCVAVTICQFEFANGRASSRQRGTRAQGRKRNHCQQYLRKPHQKVFPGTLNMDGGPLERRTVPAALMAWAGNANEAKSLPMELRRTMKFRCVTNLQRRPLGGGRQGSLYRPHFSMSTDLTANNIKHVSDGRTCFEMALQLSGVCGDIAHHLDGFGKNHCGWGCHRHCGTGGAQRAYVEPSRQSERIVLGAAPGNRGGACGIAWRPYFGVGCL